MRINHIGHWSLASLKYLLELLKWDLTFGLSSEFCLLGFFLNQEKLTNRTSYTHFFLGRIFMDLLMVIILLDPFLWKTEVITKKYCLLFNYLTTWKNQNLRPPSLEYRDEKHCGAAKCINKGKRRISRKKRLKIAKVLEGLNFHKPASG
jgi:hypothetical protein